MNVRLLITATILSAASAHATDVGVSVGVGDSGFYGRIDVGTMPRPPPVVYQQPVVVQPEPVEVERPPIYLRVPPGHAKKWKKHCREYNACGERVYFVQEGWYNTVYVPSRQAERREVEHERHGHGDDDDQGHGHGHGHGKGHGKED